MTNSFFTQPKNPSCGCKQNVARSFGPCTSYTSSVWFLRGKVTCMVGKGKLWVHTNIGVRGYINIQCTQVKSSQRDGQNRPEWSFERLYRRQMVADGHPAWRTPVIRSNKCLILHKLRRPQMYGNVRNIRGVSAYGTSQILRKFQVTFGY